MVNDRLEELLLEPETEREDVSWWKDGQRYALLREQMPITSSEQAAGKQNEVTEWTESRRLKETLGSSQVLRGWTAQELERIRRAARRTAGMNGRGEAARQLRPGTGQADGGRNQQDIRNRSVAGRQRLTAQIDMQFRRDARRYDGRLGLL